MRTAAGCRWTAAEWRPQSGADRTVAALDATLGVPGLPQSATGQTALLTGRNAASVMGRHYGPWPGPTLRRLLARDNLFAHHRNSAGTGAVRWAGASPPRYLEALETGRMRLNAPAWAARASGVPLPDFGAYRAGRAVAADLDGAAFARMGARPPGGTRPGRPGAEAAGKRIARIAAEAAFTFLDVWIPDHIGHRRDAEAGRRFVTNLDAFLTGVLEDRHRDLTVLLTSDHGNAEDLRHGRHTTASVPLLAIGPRATRFAGANSLTDVAAAAR